METHGIKIDLIGLSAVITSVVSLITIFKAKKNKEVYRGKKSDEESK